MAAQTQIRAGEIDPFAIGAVPKKINGRRACPPGLKVLEQGSAGDTQRRMGA
jgi:hypothetical protein